MLNFLEKFLILWFRRRLFLRSTLIIHLWVTMSVLENAINCCSEAKSRGYSERVQLGCLLHDSSESYISDLTRPVKKNLPQYFVIEEKLQRIIFDRFGIDSLSDEEEKMIEDVDDTLLYFEFEELMDIYIFDTAPDKTMVHDFSQRDFTNVENEFIYMFNRLTKGKNGLSFVGVDGCKLGWVAVNITDKEYEVGIFKSIEEICSKYSDNDSIIIDMPIGLPECESDVRPEPEAKSILSSRASCVFNVPCRQAVYAEDYYEANEINRKVIGKGLSKQSYAISSKIREIDELLSRRPEYKHKILEGHPEVCFAILNSKGLIKEPVYENKRTEEGMEKRILLLNQYYDKTEEIVKYMLMDSNLCKIAYDVIDALCLAVTGMIGVKNGFSTIPAKPMKDSRGITMQMVYAEPR